MPELTADERGIRATPLPIGEDRGNPLSGTPRPGIRVGSTSEFSLFFRVRPGHDHDIREAVQALQDSPSYRPGDHAISGSPVQFGPAASIKLKPGEERGKANDNIGAGCPQIGGSHGSAWQQRADPASTDLKS